MHSEWLKTGDEAHGFSRLQINFLCSVLKFTYYNSLQTGFRLIMEEHRKFGVKRHYVSKAILEKNVSRRGRLNKEGNQNQ